MKIEIPVKLKLLAPDGAVPADRQAVVVKAVLQYVRGSTRVYNLTTRDGRRVVDLPTETRFQLEQHVVVRGQLLVDDGVRVHRVHRQG